MSGLLPLERPQGYRDELVEWYNGDRHRMSLDEGKTPAEAFVRKMPPPPRQRVIDEHVRHRLRGETWDKKFWITYRPV